jgi:hypothetical protein
MNTLAATAPSTEGRSQVVAALSQPLFIAGASAAILSAVSASFFVGQMAAPTSVRPRPLPHQLTASRSILIGSLASTTSVPAMKKVPVVHVYSRSAAKPSYQAPSYQAPVRTAPTYHPPVLHKTPATIQVTG